MAVRHSGIEGSPLSGQQGLPDRMAPLYRHDSAACRADATRDNGAGVLPIARVVAPRWRTGQRLVAVNPFATADAVSMSEFRPARHPVPHHHAVERLIG